jgi:hypothetical protein
MGRYNNFLKLIIDIPPAWTGGFIVVELMNRTNTISFPEFVASGL